MRPFTVVLQTGYDHVAHRDAVRASRWERRSLIAPQVPLGPKSGTNPGTNPTTIPTKVNIKKKSKTVDDALVMALESRLGEMGSEAEGASQKPLLHKRQQPFSNPANRGLVKQYLDTVQSFEDMQNIDYNEKSKSFTESCFFLDCKPFWNWEFMKKKKGSLKLEPESDCTDLCEKCSWCNTCNSTLAAICAWIWCGCKCWRGEKAGTPKRGLKGIEVDENATRTCLYCCPGCNFIFIAFLLSGMALFLAYLYFVNISGRDGSHHELWLFGDDGQHALKVFTGWPDDYGNGLSLQYESERNATSSNSDFLLSWLGTTGRCPINATSDEPYPQDQGDVWWAEGWARSLYAGLMLGVVFGFLDNWGLFYGMDNLDPIFYVFATTVIASISERSREWYGKNGERNKWVDAWNQKDFVNLNRNFKLRYVYLLDTHATENQKETSKKMNIWPGLGTTHKDKTIRLTANLNEADGIKEEAAVMEELKLFIDFCKRAQDRDTLLKEPHQLGAAVAVSSDNLEWTSDYTNAIASVLEDDKVEWQREKVMRIHRAASDVMSGLGNTFSDFLGILLGTAALKIAEVGLNTEPGFWVLDLISIVVGCLLGCFLPALQKNIYALNDGSSRGRNLERGAALLQVFILISVFVAGGPTCHGGVNVYLGYYLTSMILIALPTIFMIVLLLFSVCGIGKFTKMLEELDEAHQPIVRELQKEATETLQYVENSRERRATVASQETFKTDGMLERENARLRLEIQTLKAKLTRTAAL